MLQVLGTIRIRFLQKKSKKKFHACVPLKQNVIILKNLPVKGLCGWYLSVRGPLPSYNPILPLEDCIRVYSLHILRGGGGANQKEGSGATVTYSQRGGGANQKEGSGATVHKARSKIPT
jgi:hypothetical protein